MSELKETSGLSDPSAFPCKEIMPISFHTIFQHNSEDLDWNIEGGIWTDWFWGNMSSETKLSPCYQKFWHFWSVKIPMQVWKRQRFHPVPLRRYQQFDCDFFRTGKACSFGENWDSKRLFIKFIGILAVSDNHDFFENFKSLFCKSTTFVQSTKGFMRLSWKKPCQQFKRNVSWNNGKMSKPKAILW